MIIGTMKIMILIGHLAHGRFLCIRKPLLYWIRKMGVKLLKKR